MAKLRRIAESEGPDVRSEEERRRDEEVLEDLREFIRRDAEKPGI